MVKATPLDPKEIVTVQEIAISNMHEIGALRELLFEKGIITKDEFISKFKKLDKGIGVRLAYVHLYWLPEKLSGRLLAIAKQAAPDACLQA